MERKSEVEIGRKKENDRGEEGVRVGRMSRKKNRKRLLAMLPDLLCLDRLQYVSCAVCLSLRRLLSCSYSSLPSHIILIYFGFCFLFHSPLNIVLFVCLDDQSRGISYSHISMQPYTRLCVCVCGVYVKYFCILLTRYFCQIDWNLAKVHERIWSAGNSI